MKKNDRFGKEWSSDSRDQQYPSDNQAAQGLGFLGADAPTTGLHDALWQANDWKDNWLYDQIKTACERYGQSLDLSVGGSRNALADAIRQALLSQNQASESRVGILEIASRDETVKGEDALRAVVPVHLRAVLDDRFSQLGSAARRNEGDFDRAGAAQEVRESLKQIAKTGELNDGTGTLAMSHGGTGRSDGNLKADTVYAGRLENTGGVSINSGSGSALTLGGGNANVANLGYGVVLTADSGDTLGIETGCAVVGKNNKGDVEFKVQKERIFIDGEDSPVIGRYKHGTFVTAKSGDTLSIEPGNAIVSHDSTGKVTVKFVNGKMTDGDVPIERMSGVLTVKHGGTGRDDGNLKADTVYAGRLENSGGISINSGAGNALTLGGGNANVANLGYGVVLTADSGDTLGIETGCAVVGKNNKGDVEFKVQKERIFIDGEDSPVIGRYKHGTFITAKSGDMLSIEPGNAIVSHDSTGKVTVKFVNGKMTDGDVPVDRVSGLGKAATRGIIDTGQPEQIGWGDENLASAGAVSGVFYRMTEHGKIGTTATMINMAENGATAGQVVDAGSLRYASCDGYSATEAYPSGRWRCLGYCLGASAPPRSRTCTFVRIQ